MRIIKLIALFLGTITTILLLSLYDWTGFGDKTLWDWMELAVIPLILFLLANYYSKIQREESQRRQHEDEQFKVLQAYVEKIQELVLEHGLTESKEGEPVANLARTITLNTLKRLDANRKNQVISLLSTLHLIQINSTGADIVISLCNADMDSMSGAGYNFIRSDLRMANLRNVDFGGVDFRGSDLQGVDVTDASFAYCDFRSAIFQVVGLKDANLYKCRFDENTIMPNGERWNQETNTSEKYGASSKPPITKEEEEQTRKELRIVSEENGQAD